MHSFWFVAVGLSRIVRDSRSHLLSVRLFPSPHSPTLCFFTISNAFYYFECTVVVNNKPSLLSQPESLEQNHFRQEGYTDIMLEPIHGHDFIIDFINCSCIIFSHSVAKSIFLKSSITLFPRYCDTLRLCPDC